MKKIPDKKVTPIPPKFNMMWLWILIILGFFGLQYFFSSDSTKEITYSIFEKEILLPGYLDILVAFKSSDLVEVGVYITKARRNDESYKEVAPTQNSLLFSPELGPQYTFTEPSDVIFSEQ